ncbi:MAG: hypothetical protein KIS66_12615 [Fimbriimonadaceae bacterium]|nr:hypothetical protein [Fimbriimonadaceae bacterium]
MRRLPLLCALVFGLLAVGCGGGGGGGGGGNTVVVTGRAVQVKTGGPPDPAASCQIGSVSALTDATGTFRLTVPPGATQVTIDSRSDSGTWTYTFPPATSATNDVGDLYIGPARVSVTGLVKSAVDDSPISGATVSFAGRSGTTNAAGRFTLADVAYYAADLNGFWGIEGAVRASGYFVSTFRAEPSAAAGAVVTLDDLLLIPTSDASPPDVPYNVWGRVSPSAQSPGTVVTVVEGGTNVRSFTVGANGLYWLWLSPGTYTLRYAKGSLHAPDQTVVLERPNQVIRRDVTLE